MIRSDCLIDTLVVWRICSRLQHVNCSETSILRRGSSLQSDKVRRVFMFKRNKVRNSLFPIHTPVHNHTFHRLTDGLTHLVQNKMKVDFAWSANFVFHFVVVVECEEHECMSITSLLHMLVDHCFVVFPRTQIYLKSLSNLRHFKTSKTYLLVQRNNIG